MFSSTRPRHLPTPHNLTPREVSEGETDLPEASPSIPASEHRRRWAARQPADPGPFPLSIGIHIASRSGSESGILLPVLDTVVNVMW